MNEEKVAFKIFNFWGYSKIRTLIRRNITSHHIVFKKHNTLSFEDRSRRNTYRWDQRKTKRNVGWMWSKCARTNRGELGHNWHYWIWEMSLNTCTNEFFQNQNRPRTIIGKLTKFKDKQKIFKYAKCLKDTGIFIYEDFCKDTIDLRKKLWNKVLEYRKQNKFVYLNYRSIVVREHWRDRAVR